MKKMLILLIGFVLMSAKVLAYQVNIYVKYDDTQLKQRIQEYNNFLETKGVFDKYHVRPFLEGHPLHNTLYLAEYESRAVPNVISSVQYLVKHWLQFEARATDIFVTDSNYVMLNVDIEKPGSILHRMQKYSDELVLQLYALRDANAPIPQWADKIPSKRAAFKRYGSPNVFFELHPHFSLLAKTFKDQQTAREFNRELKQLTKEYQQQHPCQAMSLKAVAIGIGLANYYGQIDRELIDFKLN